VTSSALVPEPPYEALPGGDLIVAGLRDLRAGHTDTAEALLVAVAGTRLRAAGVPVPPDVDGVEASMRLYHVLGPRHGDDAHGRHLALLRRLARFASAAEHETGRRR
jgi:hypothetical protein